MRFAIALPAWTVALLVLAVLLLAWAAYARPLTPLSRSRRLVLSAIRGLALLLAIACLLRPVRVMPPSASTDEVVPVLVDVSRSMRLPDARGRSRIDSARDLAQRIGNEISSRFRPEIWTFGDTLATEAAQPIAADAGRSDVAGALRALRERYRDRRVAGIVVISDGGDTGSRDAAAAIEGSGVPVFTVGVGDPTVSNDLEVSDLSAGDGGLAASSIDLVASAVSRGGGAGFDMRVLENGRPIDVRHVIPSSPGAPVRTIFTVSPPADAATLYTIEIPAAPGEPVLENNRRSVLVEAPGRRRRVLIVEGAPGFEHSFVRRALEADKGLDIDSVVRKGRDSQGEATYFVQAPAERAPQLTTGFPVDRGSLFKYDALILANLENDVVSRAQLEMASAFVSERGGGLLVLGAKTFGPRGLAGTAIEDVLPLGLTDRGNTVVRASAESGDRYKVDVTADGVQHPVMRIAAAPEDVNRRWAAVPSLAGAAALGGPHPAAQVLAVVRTADGERPLVAVQRVGQGRSMVFSGEASWRWRMQLPATDRTFELFWRQAARWLASGAPDPVSIPALASTAAGEAAPVSVEVRDAAFAPVTDAQVTMKVTLPGGEQCDVHPALTDPRTGRYAAPLTLDRPGVYRVSAEARRGSTVLGTAERWTLIGGADAEMADPRLNEEVLRRISRASGGQYLRADSVSRLALMLSPSVDRPGAPRVQELWHSAWIFDALVALLTAEWTLRRAWGMR